AAEQAASVPADWQSHTDPMGFSVRFPQGWSVATNAKKGIAEIRSQEGDSVIVWPVFSNIDFNAESAGNLAQKLAKELWPAARLQAVETVGKSAVRLRAETADRLGNFALTWVNTPKGSAGF